MNKKKITALMMAMAVIATAMPANTFAESLGGTKVLTEADLTDDKTEVAVPVTTSVNASFSVKLPTSIELTKTETGYEYSGNVGVKGVIGAGKAVTVTPKKNGTELTKITMYDVTNRPTEDIPASSSDESGYEHYSSVSATIAQDMIGWKKDVLAKTSAADGYTYADGYQMASLVLTTPDLKPAEWAGTLNYEIAYGEDTREIMLTQSNQTSLGVSNIGDVVIPEKVDMKGLTYNVTSIDKQMFYSRTELTSVIIPSSVIEIGERAFTNCTALTNVNLSENITKIEQYTFSGCRSLSSITIPSGVNSIGDSAFLGCTSLTEITYAGKQEQWNAIVKNPSWNSNSSIATIHCTDGDITL